LGKAYRLPGATDRLKKHQIKIKELEALMRNRNTPRPVASTAFAGGSPSGDSGGTGNFLNPKGDTMIGPLALKPPVDFSIDIDTDNSIDISPGNTSEQYTSNIQFEDIQPNSFVLDIIAGAAFDGQILILRTFAPSSPITISQGTLANGGNIQTGDGNDFTLGDLQIMILIFDEALKIEANVGGSWRVLAVSGGTGGGHIIQDEGTPLTQRTNLNFVGTGVTVTDDVGNDASVVTIPGGSGSFPIIPPVNVIGSVGTNQNLNLSLTTAHSHTLTLTASIDITFSNFPTATNQLEWEVEITQDGTGGHVITWPAEVVNPPTLNTSAGSVVVVVFRTNDGGTTVRVGNTVTTTGTGGFSGNWSDVVIDTNKDMLAFNLSNLSSIISTDTNPAASGFVLMGNGEFAAWRNNANDGDLSLTVNSSDRFQFTGGPIVTDTNLGNSLGNSGVRWNTLWAQTIDLSTGSGAILGATIGSTNTLVGTAVSTNDLSYDLGLKQTFSPDLGSNAGINVGSIAGDPSVVVDGDVWYNSSAAAFKFRENGATVELGSAPSSIIDSNSSLTISDTEPQLRLALNAVQDWLWQEDLLFVQSNSTNYATQYLRNTGAGVNGQFITTTTFAGNSTTSVQRNYVSEFTSMKTATNGSEDGQYNFGLFSKGSDKSAYVVEGGGGLINTNILHSFFGSMILKSDQDGDESILRLERNDTSPSDDNEIGVIQFRGENSIGSVVQYGSVTVESADVSSTSENGRFAVDLINGALTERMIVADSLTNQIKFSPTSSFSYFFDTTGFFLQKLSSNVVDADFTPIEFQSGGTPLSYAGIVPQVKESTDSGRLSIKVRSDNSALTDALVINGGNNNVRTYLSIPARITSDLGFGLVDETGSAKHKISPLSASTQLGIVVQDNASFTGGDEGTLATPLVTSGVSTTIAALDAAFGDHKGAEGFIEIASTLTKFVKQANGNWGSVAYTFDSITS